MYVLGMFLYAALNTTGEAILVSMPWVTFEVVTLLVVLVLLQKIMLVPDCG
jgi:hypothetical protein